MFIRRLVDHLLNQVLVEGLANSRWFQRFAVWSHGAMKELQAKSKDGSAHLDTHLSSFVEAAKQKSAQLKQDFQQELRKVQEQQQQMKR